VRFAIKPDAHHTSDIAYYKYGVGVARKGWLTKDDVLNTQTPAQLKKYFEARKKKKGVL